MRELFVEQDFTPEKRQKRISTDRNDLYAYVSAKKEIKEFKPNFSDDDTAFGRLLFSAAGLFFRIQRATSQSDYKGWKLLIYSRDYMGNEMNRIPIYCVHIENNEGLLISLLDAFYNFYSCISLPANEILNDLSIGIGSPDKTELKIFDIINSFQNKARGSLITPGLDRESIYQFWNGIYNDIVNDLYIDVSFYSSLNHYFDDIKEASNEIYNQIYKKYAGVFDSDEISLQAFPDYDSITRYIDSYYRLASLCLQEKDIFSQSSNAQHIVDRILNVGVRERHSKSSEIEKFWFMSPFALNSLRNVYDRILGFMGGMMYDYQKKSDAFFAMLENDYISSCIVDFRRWTYTNGTNSLVTFEGQENALSKYTYSELSSVSMVRALRLFEKIKAYLRTYEEEQIKVCIVGYTRKVSIGNGHIALPEIEELKAFVDKEFPNRKVSYTIIMNDCKNIKTFESVETFNWTELLNGTINYGAVNYKELFERTHLYNVLNNFNLLFFLDCPELYFEEFYSDDDTSINRIYRASDYKSYYYSQRHSNSFNTDLGEKLSDIGARLSVLSNKYPIGNGIYQPMLKEHILDYMNSFVNVMKKRTAIYCYLSTLESRKSSKYRDKKIMHIERYNNKLFYIVKMSHGDDHIIKKLTLRPRIDTFVSQDAVTNPIVFSFWNILKNISIRLKQTIFNMDEFFEDKNTPYYLNRIAIEMSWDKKMQNYSIRYGIDPSVRRIFKKNKIFIEGSETYLKNIIEGIFKVVLDREYNEMKISVRNEVCNVLLGRADNPIHLLNYYRIAMNDLHVDKIQCDEILYDEDYINKMLNNNQISSVSDKKLYIDAMNSLSYRIDSLEMTAIRNKIQENGGDPDFILDNIGRACEMCNYTDSILYYNLRR